MGTSFLSSMPNPIGGPQNPITVHGVSHTTLVTVGGVRQAVSVAADASGVALHDVVVNGKTVIKAGTQIG